MPPISNYTLNLFAAPSHGKGQLHVCRFEEAVADNSTFLKPHRHDHYEVFILSGKGVFQNEFAAHAFDGLSIVYVRPGQVHWWTECEHVKGICLLFDQTFCEIDRAPGCSSLLRYPFWHGTNQNAVLKVPEDSTEDIKLIGEKLYQELLEKKPWTDEIQRALLNILFQVMRRIYLEQNPPESTEVEKGDILFQKFVEVIERELPTFRNVGEYARIMGTSVSQLNKSVREAVGQTPATWLRERRLLEAKRLLIHSDFTFQEIAYELGFPDPSYFTKFFQKLTGMTPSQFKQKHQNESIVASYNS